MTRAITVRLDDADHAALERQAEHLQVRPGTLARILVHAGLSRDTTHTGTSQALTALDRLAKRSQNQVSSDAVALIAEARVGLDPRR